MIYVSHSHSHLHPEVYMVDTPPCVAAHVPQKHWVAGDIPVGMRLNNTGSCPAAIILLCLEEPSPIHSCPVPVCVCSQPHPTRPHVLSYLLLPCSALAALLAARSLRPAQHALCAPRSAFSAPLVARSLPRCFPISVLTALLAACSLPRCFPISVLAALLAACSLRPSQRALCAPRSAFSFFIDAHIYIYI
jgi:hypothetical protein